MKKVIYILSTILILPLIIWVYSIIFYVFPSTIQFPKQKIIYNTDYHIQNTHVTSKKESIIVKKSTKNNNLFQAKHFQNNTYMYPTFGFLTSYYGFRSDPFFGYRDFHRGIDIANLPYTPIYASTKGQVTKIGRNSLYGNYIIITHNRNYKTLYAHLKSIRVYKYQRVYQGSFIAYMGKSGRSTGTHLHFSILFNHKNTNPLHYIHTLWDILHK